MDGEVAMMKTPLHYVVRPGALRVIVPVKTVEESDEESIEKGVIVVNENDSAFV
jgi:hypothetical protein